MDPALWGRGAWAVIFTTIYYYIGILEKTQSESEFEMLKQIIFLMCTNLPCDECSAHARTNITENNILSTKDPNIFLHFFIELYNFFHEDKMNRKNIRIIKYINALS